MPRRSRPPALGRRHRGQAGWHCSGAACCHRASTSPSDRRSVLPPCLLASLEAEEQRIGGVVDGVVGLCVHAGGLVWWLEICPSVSPRRMNSDSQAGHKGTPTSRSSKQSKAECRDRVRTWAEPSPLRHDWMPLCVGKRRTDRHINRPEHSNAQTVFPPHQRHARSFPAERFITALRRTSTSTAQARSRAQRAGLALRG